ncbi:MAG: alpha/beta hydrolase [Candidatus Obscuribacter phosphatis]|uniref:Alpha/beta hydrolase n=1 Tax=Candidatus Obscuribacter phosphatis TaxID=1906157 RepID=A0A8J7P6M6_9BACT|nr:alpha/beta hydrolase [Candidatus Obscuribacter phosphatis]
MKKFRALLKRYIVLGIVIVCCMNAQIAVHASATSNATANRSIAMPVYYATNRQRFTARNAPIYSKKRRYLAGLEYGECTVTIPAAGVNFDAKRDYGMGWRGKADKIKKPSVSSTKSQSASEREFFDELRSRANQSDRVILFVHGYKSTFDGALSIGAQLEAEFHAPVVIFSWPSSEQLRGYTKDECNIEWSLPHFKKLLQQVEAEIGAEKLTVVAHSMGNRLVMWSLRDRCENARCHGTPLSKLPDVVLTSPDVDTGTFKHYANDICENAQETWILTSGKDNALRASKFVHERRRLGMPGPDGVDIDWRQPPVVPGLKTIEFTVLDRGMVGHTIQHGLISDLARTSSVGAGLELVPEEKDGYKWWKVERK